MWSKGLRKPLAEVDSSGSDQDIISIIPLDCSVASVLNPTAGITGYKQFILYILIEGLTVHKTALGLPNKSVGELIMNL